jgi:hypothetical protein
MILGKIAYQLMQLIFDSRDQKYKESLYGVYDSWAGAKADAKDGLSGSKWVIYKCTVVDTNYRGDRA